MVIMHEHLQIEDHPLVSFLPLDLTVPDSIETVLSHIDYTMQYGEDEEPKEVCCICIRKLSLTNQMRRSRTWTTATVRIWNKFSL